MVVRDLFDGLDDIQVIARAIYEDALKNEEVNGWITKYYAQLNKLKNSKISTSNIMLYLHVQKDKERQYGCISGFEYKDIKAGNVIYYSIDCLNIKKYASLYVPEYTVECYGKEVVAAEALREYGWNRYDESIICPDDVRRKVYEALKNMETGIFPEDDNYFERCRKQFKSWYEV